LLLFAFADAGAQAVATPSSMLLTAWPELPGTCHIRGVIRSEGGAPVSGSHLQLTASDGRVLSDRVTLDGGDYSWDGLEVGEYIVSVSTEGFLPATYGVRIPEEGAPLW
jgi:hypothetical protein